MKLTAGTSCTVQCWPGPGRSLTMLHTQEQSFPPAPLLRLCRRNRYLAWHKTTEPERRRSFRKWYTLRCSRDVGCWLWAAEESPLRGLITAAVTAVGRGRTRTLPTPAQTKQLQKFITVTPIVLTLPSCFSAVVTSRVQFQYKLSSNTAHHFTFIAMCGYGYYCVFKDP